MSKLKPFAEWQAPWEKSGKEFDADTARKYIYDLTSDKERLEGEKTEVVTARDALQAKVDEHETEGLDETEKLKREIERLKATPPVDKGAALENARLRLAIDNGLTVKQANRLQGSTPEELEADVKDLMEILGEKKEPEERDAPGGFFRTGNEDRSRDEKDMNPKELAEIFD